MASEPRSSVAFQPNALAGSPDMGLSADPYANLAANALDRSGDGAPDQKAEARNRLFDIASLPYRHANSYLGFVDYLLGRMPSTAVGLVNSAIPYQPFGGVHEAHQASEKALDDFRSLYPSTSKALLEITSNPMGQADCPTEFLLEASGRATWHEPAGQLGSRRLS